MGGYVMQLQNFSVNDGEGIRTNIFLAGCPLRCRWCANPEGQTLNNQMTQYRTVREVVDAVKRQQIFYRHSGGGVTFTGGEPTVQREFLKELTDELYDSKISLAIETCGYFEFEEIVDILKKMDLIFVDIKHMNQAWHKAYTGVSNEKILENISLIAKLPVSLVIRIPVIHSVNTEEAHLKQVFSFIHEHAKGAALELLPYHQLGEEKYRTLGMELPPEVFKSPGTDELCRWTELANEMGIPTVSYR